MDAIKKHWPLFACAAVAVISGQAVAEEASTSKTPIFVSATANQALSKTFVFELKEQIRNSSAMRVALTDNAAVRQIRIVAMDIERADSIAYSIVWTWRQRDGIAAFEDMVVGICPSRQLAQCARGVIAQTDEAIAADARMWADAVKAVPGN